jgi:3-oxoacyl-[acyl-carrier protein] reductase
MKENESLIGKNAFVGGSSKGIGRAIAEQLAEMGANVTVVARSKDILEVLVRQLPTKDAQEHDFLVADYSNLDSLERGLESLLIKKNYHIIINNTGGPPGGPIIEAGIEEFRSALNNHLFCNHLITTKLLAGMIEDGYGRVINIISTSVKQPLNGLGVSNTTRGAVANWAKTMANELGPYGITVNNVLPGATRTKRLSSIIENKAKKTGQSKADVESSMKNIIPLGRFGEATEVAAAVAFLASPRAAYISGINLPVDGGRTKSL